MADYTEAANLDREAVQRIATGYAGYGVYLERLVEDLSQAAQSREGIDRNGVEEELHRLIHGAASSYNISGSYFALIHPGAASLMFWAAARAYLRLERVYGGVLAVCARDNDLLSAYSGLVVQHAYAPREIPYAAITLAALAHLGGTEFQREAGRFMEAAGRWRGALLPDIPIPVGLFLDLFRDVSFGERGSVEEWPHSASVLLERFSEQFAAAQANSYRWRTMQERFLPVQPEVLASIILTRESVGSSMRRSAGTEWARFQEQPGARILLGVSEEMMESAPSDFERAFAGRPVPESIVMLFRQWKEHRG